MNLEELDDSKFLEKFKIKIIKNILKVLCKKYEMYEKGVKVTEDEMLKYLKNLEKKEKTQCMGILNNLQRCKRNATIESNYCKTHYKVKKEVKEIFLKENFIMRSEVNFVEKEIETNLKKRFINDSFYYTDDNYVYDIESMEKVGYKYENEFVLSMDPFILDL